MYILIVGAGNVGFYLAKELSQGHHTVSLVEKDRERCEQIAKELNNVLLINGDGCNSRYLEDAGINRADAIFAVRTING